MVKILGIDAGNSEIKVVTVDDYKRVLSCLGEWRDRNLRSSFGDDDMEYEYAGKKGFAGTLAKHESEWVNNMLGDTKAHEDAKIRILLACWRMAEHGDELRVVVGQPISKHNREEMEKIKQMLLGWHCMTVNGEQKQLHIKEVGVAAETATAILAKPTVGVARIIDIGAGTIGLATVDNMRFVDRDSLSLNLGAESTNQKNIEGMANKILATVSHKWEKEDKVYLIGGMAQQIQPYIGNSLINTEVLVPVHNGQSLHPIFANAVGFYKLGEQIWKNK